MSLLTPDIGLLFWMLLSFGAVVFILCRYGFPVILQKVDERKAYIDESLETARQAKEQMAGIQQESAALLQEARRQQAAILREATAAKERILAEAHEQAQAESRKQLDRASARIREEKEKAIREIRAEIATLSVTIAEKILRERLKENGEQQAAIDRLIDEFTLYKS